MKTVVFQPSISFLGPFAVRFKEGIYIPENEHDSEKNNSLKMHLFLTKMVVFSSLPCLLVKLIPSNPTNPLLCTRWLLQKEFHLQMNSRETHVFSLVIYMGYNPNL